MVRSFRDATCASVNAETFGECADLLTGHARDLRGSQAGDLVVREARKLGAGQARDQVVFLVELGRDDLRDVEASDGRGRQRIELAAGEARRLVGRETVDLRSAERRHLARSQGGRCSWWRSWRDRRRRASLSGRRQGCPAEWSSASKRRRRNTTPARAAPDGPDSAAFESDVRVAPKAANCVAVIFEVWAAFRPRSGRPASSRSGRSRNRRPSPPKAGRGGWRSGRTQRELRRPASRARSAGSLSAPGSANSRDPWRR